MACLMLLGGCEKQAPEQVNATAAAPEVDYQARVAALLPGQREEVLFHAIRDAGRGCPNVESAAPHAAIKGAPAWAVKCDNGLEWIVVIGTTGMAVVTSEAELKANGVAADAPH
jgi:hypothetical protein